MRTHDKIKPENAPERTYETSLGELRLSLTNATAGEVCGRLSFAAPVDFGEGPHWKINNSKWWLAPSGYVSVENTVAWPDLKSNVEPFPYDRARNKTVDRYKRNQRAIKKLLATYVATFLADEGVLAEYVVAVAHDRAGDRRDRISFLTRRIDADEAELARLLAEINES